MEMVELYCLITIAETYRKLKPVLAGKGSSRPDWLNILSNQAFHLHYG
jgi:hypothetical protein